MPNSIPARLGKPAIRMLSAASGIITCAGHTFNDIHLPDIEFSGVLESFFAISIDG